MAEKTQAVAIRRPTVQAIPREAVVIPAPKVSSVEREEIRIPPPRVYAPGGGIDTRSLLLYGGIIVGGLWLLPKILAPVSAAGTGTRGNWLQRLFGMGATATTPARAATGSQVPSVVAPAGGGFTFKAGGGVVTIPFQPVTDFFSSLIGAVKSPAAAPSSPVPSVSYPTIEEHGQAERGAAISETMANQRADVGETIQPDGTVYTPPDAGAAAEDVYQDTSDMPVDSVPATQPTAEEIFGYPPSYNM